MLSDFSCVLALFFWTQNSVVMHKRVCAILIGIILLLDSTAGDCADGKCRSATNRRSESGRVKVSGTSRKNEIDPDKYAAAVEKLRAERRKQKKRAASQKKLSESLKSKEAKLKEGSAELQKQSEQIMTVQKELEENQNMLQQRHSELEEKEAQLRKLEKAVAKSKITEIANPTASPATGATGAAGAIIRETFVPRSTLTQITQQMSPTVGYLPAQSLGYTQVQSAGYSQFQQAAPQPVAYTQQPVTYTQYQQAPQSVGYTVLQSNPPTTFIGGLPGQPVGWVGGCSGGNCGCTSGGCEAAKKQGFMSRLR